MDDLIREALEAAREAINGLADQQAMADNWYLPHLAKIDAALREKDEAITAAICRSSKAVQQPPQGETRP